MSVRKFSQILPILLDKERGEIDGLTIFQILKLTYHVTWHIVSVWIQRLLHFAFFVFCFLFFVFAAAHVSGVKFHCSWTVAIYIWLFSSFSSHSWVPYTVHETHKLHFSVTFSLKIGLTTLFTNLKIILLQVFSIFSKNKLYPNGPRSSSIEILDNKVKVFKLGLTVRLEKPQTAQNYGPFNIKNRSMQKKQGPIQTTVRPPDSVNHERFWRFKPELFLFIKKIKTLQTHSTKSPLLKLQP